MAGNPTFDRSMEWLSRTITIIIFMLVPGILGSYLDGKWGTSFLTPVGIFVGMAFALGMLLLLAKKLTPPARGEPIPFEDEQGNDPWNAPASEDGTETKP